MLKMMDKNLIGTRGGFLLLLVISLAVKVSIWVCSPVIIPDGPIYINQAQDILAGQWREALSLAGGRILFPILIAVGSFLSSDLMVIGRLISLICSVATLFPLFLLSRQLFGPKPAFWACLAFAVVPGLNEYAVYVVRDPLFLLIAVSSVWMMLKAWQEVTLPGHIMTLVLAFLALLTRQEGMIIALAVVLVISWTLLRQSLTFSARQKRAGVALACLILISAGLIIATQSDYLEVLAKKPLAYAGKFIDRGLFSYDDKINVQLKEMELEIRNGQADNDFAEIAREHVHLIYGIGLASTLRQVISLPIIFFSLVGAFFWRGRDWTQALVASVILLFLAMNYLYMLHHYSFETRYAYVPAVLLLPWFGAGFEMVREALLRRTFPGRPSRKVLGLIIALFFIVPAIDSARDVKRQILPAKDAGLFLATQSELSGVRMLANNREIPYYAGRLQNHVFDKRLDHTNPAAIERQAMAKDCGLIAITLPKEILFDTGNLDYYVLLKEFEGEDYRSTLLVKRQQP